MLLAPGPNRKGHSGEISKSGLDALGPGVGFS
jgi:hypothetical protein